MIEDLKDDGKVTRGWLGIQIQPLTPISPTASGIDHTKGAIVARVQDGSPAEKAGLKVGDLVLQIAGEQVEDAKDLARKVARIDPDTEVEFTSIATARRSPRRSRSAHWLGKITSGRHLSRLRSPPQPLWAHSVCRFRSGRQG